MHTATDTKDEKLIGADIAFGAALIGRVLPLDGYGHPAPVRSVRADKPSDPLRKRVAHHSVVRRTPTCMTLGGGTRELEDLPDQRELGPWFSRAGISRVNGAAL